MARILFLTQVLPYPLDAGPKVRAYYMLRHLAAQYDVTLVSFVRPDDRPEYSEHLRGIASAVHTVPIQRSMARNVQAGVTGLLSGLPIVIARDEMDEMALLLRRLASETPFDVVHADQLSMAWWGRLAAEKGSGNGLASTRPVTLLDEHNAIYALTERLAREAGGLRRIIAQREAGAFRRYEADMVRFFDAVLTVTDEDRTLLLDLFDPPERALQASKFTTVPICVDPAAVQPIDRSSSTDSPVSILHLGTMFWPPNVAGVLWFAREVLPLIWQRIPDARFVVAGKKPPADVCALTTDPRIQVTGYVADPLPYLQAADVFVVPLFSGGGMRVKILDAWLWGLPIVSTPIGAEGIDLRDGENILIAGDARSFADATIRLLANRELNQQLRSNGRQWVEQTYAWQVVYRRVDAVYTQLLDNTS
ncbi:MAG: glycosyltransferase [Anaerolineae bacterium]|nr:glycosyltransferase [Anaerolineae bacterium]